MNYILHFKDESSCFQHYGVLGMRWGVIRSNKELSQAKQQRAKNSAKQKELDAKVRTATKTVNQRQGKSSKYDAAIAKQTLKSKTAWTQSARDKASAKLSKLEVKKLRADKPYYQALRFLNTATVNQIRLQERGDKLDAQIKAGEQWLKSQGIDLDL